MAHPASISAPVQANNTPAVLTPPTRRSASHTGLFFALYTGFLLLTLFLAILGDDASLNRPAYHAVLFGVALWPAFFIRDRKGEHRLLIFLSGIYYIWFGAADYLLYMLSQLGLLKDLGAAAGLRFTVSTLFEADALIIGGLIGLHAGYFLLYRIFREPRATARAVRDWQPRAAIRLAFVLWLIGFAMSILVLIFELSHAGTWTAHLIANLSYLSFLAPLTLIYFFWKKERRATVRVVLLTMILAQAALGMLTGSKGLVLQLVVMLIIGNFLLFGRFSKGIMVMVTLTMIVLMPVYTVMFHYRDAVLMDSRGKLTGGALRSAQNLSSSLGVVSKAIEGRDLFLEGTAFTMARLNQRYIVDVVVQHAGKTTPYLRGESLFALAYSFIPSALWKDKKGVSIGKIANRTFRVSVSSETFIAITLLGEFYWNFGYWGAIGCMALIGALVAGIARRCSMVPVTTAPRFLVLAVSAQYLGMQFETGFGTQTHFIRTLLLIWLISVVMKRMGSLRLASSAPAA